MRARLVGFILFIFSSVAAAGMPPPQVVKLNARVYALLAPVELPDERNQGYIVNSTLIVGERGVIVVDTGFSHEIGLHLRKAIAGITSKPVTYVINTHDHGDHYLGNTAFPGAKILSSEKCREGVRKNTPENIALIETMIKHKTPATRGLEAQTVFAENTRNAQRIEGVPLVLWVPKASHTAGDLLVYLPEDKIMIGGDVLVQDIMPNFRDANIKSWLDTLQQAQDFDFDVAVPGHGPLMHKADVVAMRQRMTTLYAGIEAGYKKGLNDSEIRAHLDLSEWRKLKRYDELMGGNINRAYLEVEAANF